jgi:hypothetical protein
MIRPNERRPKFTGTMERSIQLKQNVSFLPQLCAVQQWPMAPDGLIFAGCAVMRAGPGAVCGLQRLVILD